MTDARAASVDDVRLIAAAAAGRLTQRYLRDGWHTVSTDRAHGWRRAVDRRVRRLVGANLLTLAL
jgi:hypothetical protein